MHSFWVYRPRAPLEATERHDAGRLKGIFRHQWTCNVFDASALDHKFPLLPTSRRLLLDDGQVVRTPHQQLFIDYLVWARKMVQCVTYQKK